MEKEKKTFKQDTKKTHIGFNGSGNICGLLLLGGALVATLAARHRKGNKPRDSDDKSKTSQGLHFILQPSSPTNSSGNQCCTNNGSTELVATQIDDSSDELLTSTPSLIFEDNPSPTNTKLENSDNCDQEEIFLTYDSEQDCTKMCGRVEEFLLPELKNDTVEETYLIATAKIAENDVTDARVEEFLLPELKNDTLEETCLIATAKIAEKDVTDAVRMSIQDISSVQSTESDDDHEEEKKKQAKEKLIAEEKKSSFSETEEPIDVQECAEPIDGDNLRNGSPWMEITEVKNEAAATDEVEADAIDVVNIRVDENLSALSTDKEDDEENKQAKEKLLLEEKIKTEEDEERIAVETCAQKTSNTVEEDDGDGNLEHVLPLTDIPEVKNEEAIDEVEEEGANAADIIIEETLSAIDKEDGENKQASEKLLLEENIKVEEEEERIAAKTCAEKTSLNTVDEDNGVDHIGNRSALVAKPEVNQEEESLDEVAEEAIDVVKTSIEEEAIDVIKMSIEKISSVQSRKEDDDEEKKHSIDEQEDVGNTDKSDDERILKSDKSSGGTGSSSAVSDGEEIWPVELVEALPQELMNIMKNSRLSVAKTAKQDGINQIGELSHFNSYTDIIQTTANSTFTNKEENLEFTVWNKQTTYSRKWRITDKHMLIMASILLLLLPIATHYFIRLLRNDE